MSVTEKSIYEYLGGEDIAEAKIKKLVEDFYFYMDTLPEAKEIRLQHPKDISTSVQKLYDFLVGWTGGPQLYIEKHGHPRLRARHLPFKIGIKERDQWLFCMFKSLDQSGFDQQLTDELKKSFAHIANFMRNQDEI